MKNLLLILSVLYLCAVQLNVYASETDDEGECPVGLVNGLSLNQEFGAGSEQITHCLQQREKVKLLVQANQFCMDNVSNASCTRPYALLNLEKMIDDYEITHGMKIGRDYQMSVIAHTKGGPLMLKDSAHNPFADKVTALINKGVKFYLCQNATRAMINRGLLPAGEATANIIEGVEYVTAGLTAVVDFQYQGFVYVQP